MKRKLFIFVGSVLVSGSLLAAEQVNVSVKGMVCSFCAQGIKKKFGSEKAVVGLDVNLDEKWVKFQIKDNEKLEDEKIKSLINEAGYNVVEIKRTTL